MNVLCHNMNNYIFKVILMSINNIHCPWWHYDLLHRNTPPASRRMVVGRVLILYRNTPWWGSFTETHHGGDSLLLLHWKQNHQPPNIPVEDGGGIVLHTSVSLRLSAENWTASTCSHPHISYYALHIRTHLHDSTQPELAPQCVLVS